MIPPVAQNDPLAVAKQRLGARLVEVDNSTYELDGIPADLGSIMQATNWELYEAGEPQIRNDPDWVVMPPTRHDIDELVWMAWTCKSSQIPESGVPDVSRQFADALRGHDLVKVNAAFFRWCEHQNHMPTPADILSILARHERA